MELCLTQSFVSVGSTKFHGGAGTVGQAIIMLREAQAEAEQGRREEIVMVK